MSELSHYDATGKARMVDVSGKAETKRSARAQAFVRIRADVLEKLPQNPKGNPLEVARIAGIMAAKRTSELIPLCHPLALTRVAVDFELLKDRHSVQCIATVETVGPTGVEMEALTAVQVALLTIYDMCKAVDRGMVIAEVRVLEKSGGKSGHFLASSS